MNYLPPARAPACTSPEISPAPAAGGPQGGAGQVGCIYFSHFGEKVEHHRLEREQLHAEARYLSMFITGPYGAWRVFHSQWCPLPLFLFNSFAGYMGGYSA